MACMSRADTLHKADTQSTIEEALIRCNCRQTADDGCHWATMDGKRFHHEEGDRNCGAYWVFSGCDCAVRSTINDEKELVYVNV